MKLMDDLKQHLRQRSDSKKNYSTSDLYYAKLGQFNVSTYKDCKHKTHNAATFNSKQWVIVQRLNSENNPNIKDENKKLSDRSLIVENNNGRVIAPLYVAPAHQDLVMPALTLPQASIISENIDEALADVTTHKLTEFEGFDLEDQEILSVDNIRELEDKMNYKEDESSLEDMSL